MKTTAFPFHRSLLAWYQKNRRDLPWRRTKDPYKIWVSEIMLQQTTVEAVIPYYEKFLRRFPTVRLLARAGEEEVLSLWSGLGYYSRARNLHRAARDLTPRPPLLNKERGRKRERFENLCWPQTAAEWQKLPGIGRYTAGAIASIAFDLRAPILDGNVVRVLSRLFALKENPKSSRGQEVFWGKAEEVLPRKNCGDFNQALMELGATVCLPENPLCDRCPVSRKCRARALGNPESFPKGKKKTVYRDVRITAAVIREGGRVLLIRRPGNGLLKGMWEVPMVEGDSGALRRQWPVQLISPLAAVRHSVLNRRLKIAPFVCRLRGDLPAEIPHRWIRPSHLSRFPASSMNRKIMATFLR